MTMARERRVGELSAEREPSCTRVGSFGGRHEDDLGDRIC